MNWPEGSTELFGDSIVDDNGRHATSRPNAEGTLYIRKADILEELLWHLALKL